MQNEIWKIKDEEWKMENGNTNEEGKMRTKNGHGNRKANENDI